MDRRAFFGAAALACVGASFVVHGETAKKVRRIGMLSAGTLSPSEPAPFYAALRELGWIEGENLIIERRGAAGKSEVVPALAVELVRLQPDLIWTDGAVAGIAAKNATAIIPIVAISGDPVRLGLVSSMSHPGGNITGISTIAPELANKRLEILRELIPNATRAGEMVDRANRYWYVVKEDYERAFASVRLQPIFVELASADAIPGAIADIAHRGADALIVRGDPMFSSNRERIARLALQYALPTIAETRGMPAAGQLLSYGPNTPAFARRVASIVDRVLQGTRPGDMPIEQPTKFELVINLTTAKALGLTIPQSLLLRADEVIQ
jgi:ABC-type uncharacterized transport system substrate-binding protein